MVAFLWLFAGTSTHADFSGFVDQLLNMNIPINKILSQTGINRYELTRLLNAVECKDCIVPNNEYLNRYTNLFWQNFVDEPGKDFDDILYKQATYNKKSYYYCVAYVGDKTYMRWYPAETSPVCAGKFCWTRYTTKAEFLQVIMNMIAKYLYPVYSLNWANVQEWVDDLNSWSYAYKNFTDTERKAIKTRAKECGKQICNLQSADELNIYFKYCMFNLKECGMIPFEKIKEGYWPVAELNVLYKQQMISLDDAVKYNIGNLIDGKLAVEILSHINNLIGCSFINDYDCDGIDNTLDSCPTTYNPQQKDYDKDGIGDACDDDIDNDSIKNPIGIVDDNGNINIALWTPTMDNCLFIVNKDQSDTNQNGIGDACEQSLAMLSLSIAIQNTQGLLPKTITFWALSKWPVEDLQRDFWDGSIWSWSTVSHTYFAPWLYTIRLFAKGKWTNDAYAKTTIIVWRNIMEKQWLSVINTPLITEENGEGTFSLSSLGTHDEYQRTIWGTTLSTKTSTLKKKFSSSWTYPISVKALHKWEIVAATLFSFGVGTNAYGSMILPSSLFPDKNQEVRFETKIANFFPSNIDRILWDFGDGEQLETKQTIVRHSYKSVGKKIIFQTIILRNWTKLSNMITLFVWTQNLFSSYSLQLLPSTLQITPFKSFDFSIVPWGDSLSSLLFANIVWGDWTSTTFSPKNRLSFPLKQTHRYKNPWIYYPQTTIALDQCTQLSSQSTLAVWWQDFCLQAKTDWSLLNFICDMDKDNIPDICDMDIDGDGIPNLLGTINPSNSKNCNYLSTLKNNTQTLINTDLLKIHFKGICTLDNAPYTPNQEQGDANRNGIGDLMEKNFDENTIDRLSPLIDSDNDSIPDQEDLCPLIPESWNGITDYDGCPEIGLETYCENNRSPWEDASIIDTPVPAWPDCGNDIQDEGETCLNCPQDIESCLFITTSPCLQCPCPFAEIDTNLTNNDIVKAILRDKQKKYPRGYSLDFPISY